MHITYLLLGSNEGNRLQYLRQAAEAIEKQIGKVLQSSSVYESEPWGFESEQQFLNQVQLVSTNLLPMQVLAQISMIEQQAGRRRMPCAGYESRTLDVDILFYDQLVVETESLQIPHPRLHLRSFTLAPLVEIAAEWRHPVLQHTMRELYLHCDDKSKVWKIPLEQP